MRGELFGDPYFGLMLKKLMFDQNSYILKDTIIDMIYTQLAIFIPQIKVRRQDIDIVQDREKGKLYCNFSGINQIDYQHNTFNLVLLEDNEQESTHMITYSEENAVKLSPTKKDFYQMWMEVLDNARAISNR